MNNPVSEPVLSRFLVGLLATAVGIIVANLYYAQPLVALISHSLGLAPSAAGLVVTLTQIGYGLGVLLIVPLGDVVEARRLMITMISVAILGVLGLSFATDVVSYFLAALATGLGASTVQIIMPYAAHFAPDHRRGQVVGLMSSGLMIGIMLSRPIAGFLTDLFSWHAVFVLSAILMVLLIFVVQRFLPKKPPTNAKLHYKDLLKSMAHLFATTPILRRRAIYQGFLFAAFCLFWTTSPLYLAGPQFQLSQSAIAIFALVGVAGAVSAPFAGLASDRGWIRPASIIAMGVSSLSFVISHFWPAGSTGALAALVVAAILLDAGITASLVLGQRAIFSLAAEHRSRLNGLYIAVIFIGGATGSTLGTWAYARGGWELTSWVGFALPLAALLYFFTENRASSGARSV
jgi:predicted MFS family arabinose efflux permease